MSGQQKPAKLKGFPSRVPGLLSEATDDGVVIVSPTRGQLRVLNQIGSEIWSLLDGTHSVEQLEASLLTQYRHVDPFQISQDLEEFLKELMNRGLISGVEF